MLKSFSHKTKIQICKQENKTISCKRAELLGLICFSGIVTMLFDTEQNMGFKIILETEEIGERICILMAEVFDISPDVKIKNNKYIMNICNIKDIIKVQKGLKLEEDDNIFYLRIDDLFVSEPLAKMALIRGAFLGGGSVSDPQKSYHLEFATRSYDAAIALTKVMEQLGFEPKTTTRKNEVIVYLKESDKIADLLAMMGAHNALMEIYDTKILKEMRNNINRQVNCDTANMTKTADAAARQMIAINKIKDTKGIEFLDDSLQEIALLRLECPESNLKELGQALSSPIGKSGANHRMNRILEIASSI